MATLRQQAINSVKWTALQTLIVGIIGPVLLFVKARFLSPVEFGYIAIILIVTGFVQLIENFGISQAIIQKDHITLQDTSTIFFFNIATCVFQAIVLYVAAPLFATIFSLPDLTEYLRILCIAVLLNGPTLLYRAVLEKQMYFKFLSLIAISSNLITLGATTYFLISGLGVKGIVFAQIIGVFFSTLAILTVSIRFKTTKILPYFNLRSLLPFLRFGFFVSSKQIMTFAAHRLDEFLIGYFLEPEVLGIYHFGKSMLEKFRALITNSFSKVLFPVMSQLKNNLQTLYFAYQQISQYIGVVAFPTFMGIAATAHLFVPVVFGEKWIDSVIVFQVFSITIIFLVLTANVASSLLYAVNKPDIVLYIDIATNFIYFSFLFIFAENGMIAILITYSFYVICKTLTLQYFANLQLKDGLFGYFQKLFMPMLFSLIMVAIVLNFQVLTSTFLGTGFQLTGSIVIGVSIYLVLSWFFSHTIIVQLKSALIKGDIIES